MSIYDKCLVCGQEFPPNDSLECLARGQRVAYDPVRGRLWVVCGACRQWSLVPLESRWEALEELEKLIVDEGRVLSRTDNVALLRARNLEVVRVGCAPLREQSWWRYGRELHRRRERTRRLAATASVGGAVAFGASLAAGGVSMVAAWMFFNQGDALVSAARWLRFGSTAWQGQGECPACGQVAGKFPFSQRHRLVWTQGGDGETGSGRARVADAEADEDSASMRVRVPCPDCDGSWAELHGRDGVAVLRRVLAYHHFSGAASRTIERAAKLVEAVGGAERLHSRFLRDGKTLREMGRTGAVALEIALHETDERRLLEMELAELEARWRREEELAGIIDGELSSAPLLESVRRRVAGVQWLR